ncbi:helix-turn-helix transcriptional regulator [Flavobacterium foetidum]|uniref:helix-turn-helix transcriptional regulator n=1 Tax=Flavobacterium foetidum TaxID=2026681 RepID=UPI0010752A38|nr:AraC family transcriptional regulator [Flavobacterium foetidum]KAF2517144.1 helix-turn-helix transcriptional regulator [Flavobacterium foetidum]
MEQLKTGQFFGQTSRHIQLGGLTITDTQYTHEKVDWHYHEKPYFTFILQGKVLEGNKKEIYQCSAGSLLFHNWDDSHYNIKPPGFTRGFHIEIEQNWLDQFDFSLDDLKGSLLVENPEVKLLFYKLFAESCINDDYSNLSVDALLLNSLKNIKKTDSLHSNSIPKWAKTLKEFLHENFSDEHSLTALSKILNVHPVHLSRSFPKYFGCTFGEYIRKIRIEKSLALLTDKENSLVEISCVTNFSDQSHYIRCFKEQIGLTPSNYRKLLI